MMFALDDADDITRSEFELASATVRGYLVAAADDFYTPALREVCRVAALLDGRGEAVTATAIVGAMRSEETLPLLKSLGGLELIVDLVEYGPWLQSLDFHATRVRKAAKRRRLVLNALALHRAAQLGDGDAIARALAAVQEGNADAAG